MGHFNPNNPILTIFISSLRMFKMKFQGAEMVLPRAVVTNRKPGYKLTVGYELISFCLVFFLKKLPEFPPST